ncbi:MAG TPA: uridine diphosphate-N-acetylglucosamine-binding protein YvcK, partial [Candidatus Hypogeohydataceae bacterium YC38]
MRIKAVIFDLDDTLYDCTGLLVEASRRRAAKAMVEAGLPLKEEDAYQLQKTVSEKYGPSSLVFNEIAKMYGLGHSLVECALRAYNSGEVFNVQPFPDVIPTLKQLRLEKYKLFLVTTGVHRRQERKLELLGLAHYFDEVVINDQEVGLLLEDCFRALLEKYDLLPQEVAVVGDRIGVELRVAKTMGMFAVQMLHGRFKVESPLRTTERPDYKIKKIYQLPTILELINIGRYPERLRVVAVGGGTGLPIVLQGMKTYSKNLTAIVTVTDSGRSSGLLREQYGVLPPGDARNCLVALSETEEQQADLYRLFQYRFNRGSLNGISLGNLLMTALTDITGSFEEAIKKASKILAINGKVLPSTLQDTHICAELEDGSAVQGELNVRQPGKAPIRRVLLESDNVEPLPESLEELGNADIIVLGPGSLYTSVIPNILVKGIREAIRDSRAAKIYVCNIVTQPGQTDGYTPSDHIRAIVKHLGEGVLDYVLVNNNMPRADILDRYEKQGAHMVRLDPQAGNLFVKIVETDLVEEIDTARILWEKQDLLRH